MYECGKSAGLGNARHPPFGGTTLRGEPDLVVAAGSERHMPYPEIPTLAGTNCLRPRAELGAAYGSSAGSSLTNTATVSAFQFDSNLANNSSTVVTVLNHNPVSTEVTAGGILWRWRAARSRRPSGADRLRGRLRELLRPRSSGDQTSPGADGARASSCVRVGQGTAPDWLPSRRTRRPRRTTIGRRRR